MNCGGRSARERLRLPAPQSGQPDFHALVVRALGAVIILMAGFGQDNDFFGG